MSVSVLIEFVRGIATTTLERHGVLTVDATSTFDALIEADLRGHDSRGVNRLPPGG
jgi:LDH2 family malate/lactate/ureidoglycolate dehydrogenase